MVLQQMDQKATDLDLSFKPSKCVSYLFDGSQHNRQGIELSGGITKSITEGGTKFLGKSLEVSLSATKSVANKKMCNLLSNLLSTTDVLPIRGEYKLWLYRNYIISLLRFHLSVDAVTKGAVTKMENMATCYLKKWLGLPRSATRAVLYYPGMCCPSISQVSRQARLSLLSCIDASSDYQLQELGLQLHLGDAYLQTHASDYSILSEARSQLTSFPMARQLYLLSKKLIAADECSCYNKHLDTLSVQCKLKDSVSLESCCGTWNRLLLGCNPGHISFVLRAASDTLPTAVNLQRWRIQCSAKCSLCGCTQPTTAHVLGGCPSALTQGRFTFCHNQVLYCLASELSKFVAGQCMVSVYADLPGMRASDSPQTTIPPSLLITPYRPDIAIYNQINNSVALLELTCPLDSVHHLESARERKQRKTEYQQILSEFDRLGTPCSYYTIELSVLGHYLPSSLSSFQNCVNFIQNEITMTRSNCRRIFDLAAAAASISSSRRIFMAKDCKEWLVEN